MKNANTAIRFHPDARPSEHVFDLSSEFQRKDNASFLAEVAKRLGEEAKVDRGPGAPAFHAGGLGAIGLIGSYGLFGYRMRRAQEVFRVDRSPSSWSHAFLVASPLSEEAKRNRSVKSSAWIWEASVAPPEGWAAFRDRNGVGPRRIADYSRASFDVAAPHCVPNVAVISFALTPEERQAILDRADNPDVDQLRYDFTELLGVWYASLVSRAPDRNPFAEGVAHPGAAYVQLGYDAAGIDLTPGAHQRNASPEHLWQGVKYLHETFRVYDRERDAEAPRPFRVWSCVRDRSGLLAPPDAEVPGRISELTGD